jgi:hypothetical protein
MTPSFERLNYLLRSNKNMERKVVFDMLLHGRQLLSIADPVYLGLGSIWFEDFRLAHRVLGLQTMISIEREIHAPRADFNKPYASIRVLPGDCFPVMQSFAASQWQSPIFAWLDFDGALNEEVASTIDLFLNRCAANSVVIVTVNALRKRYAPSRIAERREETSIGYIERTLGGGTVHPRFEPRITGGGKFEDVSDADFPECLSDSILSLMANRTRILARETHGQALTFVPLFNLCHEDGAPMVTAGGAVCALQDSPTWERCVNEHAMVASANGFPRYSRLDLIPITLKEKLTMDSCLPELEPEFLSRALEAGVKLTADQIEKYRLLNRHVPVFVESPI